MIASRLRELDQQMSAGWFSDSLIAGERDGYDYGIFDGNRRVALVEQLDAERIAALRNALPALANVVEAAGPMASLPYPLSSDERDDWRVYQQKLIAALAELAEALDLRP